MTHSYPSGKTASSVAEADAQPPLTGFVWHAGRFVLQATRPWVMGIVNVTPDSFSDGGHRASLASALAHGEQLLAEGADVLDIGGESTRPGAQPVPLDVELKRVLPVVRHAVTLGVPVSIDTYKPAVMRAALDLGADIINDIWALRQPGALEVAAASPRCGLCLMHMQGDPLTMQLSPHYDNVIDETLSFWQERLQAVETLGIARPRIVLDPGIGFGKRPEDNLALLQGQSRLLTLGQPLLLGWSRKSTLGLITGKAVADRQAASIAAALAAVARGAHMVRVHDVAATVDALKVWQAASAGQTAAWPTVLQTV